MKRLDQKILEQCRDRLLAATRRNPVTESYGDWAQRMDTTIKDVAAVMLPIIDHDADEEEIERKT